jgi:phosphoribosylaminoimidazole carboxylase (NCAIR synthetase)
MLSQSRDRSGEGRLAVFVAPFLAPTTLRFVGAAARLAGARVALVSQDPADRLPAAVRAALVDHVQVPDALDPAVLEAAVAGLERRHGPPQRLLGALEQLQVPLAGVRERRGIPGMDVETARNFRDKSRMKDRFRAAGVPCAAHRLAGDADEALRAARELGFPLVVKPPAGAAAKGTFRVADAGELAECVRAMPPSAERPLLLEEFVSGEEHSFDSVSVGGRMRWHSLTHYRPGPLEVLRNPWIQWTVLLPREVDHPRYDDIRRTAASALASLGLVNGLTHMEWFRRGDGSIAVSEVAARPPGAQFTTLISWAHDVDFYRAWAELMIFERFAPPERRYAAGIAYLRGQGRGRVRRILGLDAAQREMGAIVVEVQLPQAGQHPASSYEGEGYVVLRHERTEVVAAALARLVELVRVELG